MVVPGTVVDVSVDLGVSQFVDVLLVSEDLVFEHWVIGMACVQVHPPLVATSFCEREVLPLLHVSQVADLQLLLQVMLEVTVNDSLVYFDAIGVSFHKILKRCGLLGLSFRNR